MIFVVIPALMHYIPEEDEIKRKSEMAVSYDPHVAEEVLRLFPAERYIPMVENAKEDIEVKDVLLFVGLLIRGAQGFADRHKGIHYYNCYSELQNF